MTAVFISFKFTRDGVETHDRRVATELHDALASHGVNVFFAPISLAQIGESDYSRQIDIALDRADTLVVVGTSLENIDSEWVRYEWQSFLNDIRSGSKPDGRLFTLTRGINPNGLPRSLRQHQNMHARDLGQLVDMILVTQRHRHDRSSSARDESPTQHSADGEELVSPRPSPFEGLLRTPTVSDVGDVIKAFASRSEAAANLRLEDLYRKSTSIDVSGLSLNFLCQQFPSDVLLEMVTSGVPIRALFLSPGAPAMASREAEEGYEPGRLASLTQLNIEHLETLRSRLPSGAQERLEIRLSDRPIRFNITVLGGELCVCQPYLPVGRGVDSPTLVLIRRAERGLFKTFSDCFDQLWIAAEGL